jgi:hypothetical protein
MPPAASFGACPRAGRTVAAARLPTRARRRSLIRGARRLFCSASFTFSRPLPLSALDARGPVRTPRGPSPPCVRLPTCTRRFLGVRATRHNVTRNALRRVIAYLARRRLREGARAMKRGARPPSLPTSNLCQTRGLAASPGSYRTSIGP